MLINTTSCHLSFYLQSFSHHTHQMVFHWSLRDNKSPQVSRTLLSILANRNNAIVWMASIRPLISSSSGLFSKPFVTIPSIPVTIVITVTHSKIQELVSLIAFFDVQSVIFWDGKVLHTTSSLYHYFFSHQSFSHQR